MLYKDLVSVFVLVNANSEIGYGHVSRMKAILDYFPFSCEKYIVSKNKSIIEFFPQAILISNYQIFDNEIYKIIKKEKVAILISDNPFDNNKFFKFDNNNIFKIAILDDLKTLPNAHIVFHPFFKKSETIIVKNRKVLSGSDFIIINPEFIRTKNNKINREYITFMIGSSRKSLDLLNLILNKFEFKDDNDKYRFILSKGVILSNKMKCHLDSLKLNVIQHLTQNDVSIILKETQICVTTGGMSLIEALVSGCCVINHPSLKSMEEESRYLENNKAIINISQRISSKNKIQLLIDSIELLKSNPRLRKMMLSNSCKIFDSLGIIRFNSIISIVIYSMILLRNREIVLKTFITKDV